MERYAQIRDQVVIRVIESGTDPDGINGEWVACGNAGPDWIYNNGVFTAPPVVEPAPKYLSKLGFRNRFTSQEKALIEFAALDNPAGTLQERMTSAGIRASLADQRDAQFINPLRPDTRQGVIDMETAGLLQAGRALQILDAPIQDEEMYKG